MNIYEHQQLHVCNIYQQKYNKITQEPLDGMEFAVHNSSTLCQQIFVGN